MAKDPVCEMTVKEEKGLKSDHKGQAFFSVPISAKIFLRKTRKGMRS